MFPVMGDQDVHGGDRSLWNAISEQQRTLVVNPTHFGIVRTGASKSNIDRVRRSASNIHYARNMSWQSQSLLCATTRNRVHGGGSWTSLYHDCPLVMTAFSLWANSTLGLMVHWTRGSRTHPGRSRTQLSAIKTIPCPRLDRLDKRQLEEVQYEFDRLSDKELKPASNAFEDKIREDIDNVVLSMLGISRAGRTVSQLRELWCKEPSVCP